ncbi:MAG: hypothetical protein ACO3NK_07055, partial [Prochlorotrichaceae cyanobacterium]
MLNSNFAHRSIQTALFGSIGFLSIGLQPASAITLSGSASALQKTGFGCNNLTANISECYGFNNFDNSSTWLTAADGGKWAIKGTIIAASANLSSSSTGQGTAAKIMTLTNATLEYKGGATTGSTSTFSGFSFSHNFEFTTQTRAGTALFTNPTVSHRLSGQLQSSDGLYSGNKVISNVSFNGIGRIGSNTNPEVSVTYTNALTTNSITASGNPFGTNFTFYDAKDASMASLAGFANTSLYLKNGTLSATLQNVVLAQGDTLYLPASECTVLHTESGQNNGHGNGDQDAPGKSGDKNNAENSENSGRGNSGNGRGGNTSGAPVNNGSGKANDKSQTAEKLKKRDKLEGLCNRVARSVVFGDDYPSSIPEPNSA